MERMVRSHDKGYAEEQAQVRSKTEVYLLKIARDAAQRATEFKQQNDRCNELKQAIIAVITAQAAIEGFFHDFFDTQLRAKGKQHDFERIREIRRLKQRLEEGLAAIGISVDKGKQPWQDLDLLVDIRNTLVHYYPKWESPQTEEDLVKRVKSTKRFELDESRSRWDEQLFTASCAWWAYCTAIRMIKCYRCYSSAELPEWIEEGIKDCEQFSRVDAC